ncbi:unnamed protein product [Arctia plantaginis]|uniref:Uncharacterized protein n=1 Tax=Arctia plantaginis TaxID=874455 RepID=A0A8S1BHV2_ARCPL|nr:unnamed protein product [Arctia plantaginis]
MPTRCFTRRIRDIKNKLFQKMFQYDYEKRPPSANSCDSRATVPTDWSRRYPNVPEPTPNARRPLPPRPSACHRIPDKTTVPLKVWIIASASCFAVCAALVLATVFITKWGTGETYTTREVIKAPAPIHSNALPEPMGFDTSSGEDLENLPVLEKLSIFKNIVANREHKNLISKPQIHPIHDDILHEERNIRKKDKAVLENGEINKERVEVKDKMEFVKDKMEFVKDKMEFVKDRQPVVDKDLLQENDVRNDVLDLPKFKPILSNLGRNIDMDLSLGFDAKEDYVYNDENFYDDYMQSNTMTSYLIEKVQELHDWVSTDTDLNSDHTTSGTDFSSLLKALNETMVDGNLTIVMSKLKDMYFGENYTNANNSSRKVIVTNSTDLLSFGILTLDVMLLHNIQLMAWENQETARIKMLQDPDVFAFNALFLDPSKMEAKQNELHDGSLFLKRLMPRQDPIDDMDIGKNFLENILEVGMSTARAAIHLGRAYKNTKNIIAQLQNKDLAVQSPISRNIDANTHALNHLQTSFDSTSVTNANNSSDGSFYTELDCVWLLYCRNLVATTKLNAPYGTMARINGVALRMLTGELPSNRALDTMLYEVLTGWTELKCNEMFPRCSKVNAASVVMDSLLQGHRKPSATNRGR